jgi:hypothetical protein
MAQAGVELGFGLGGTAGVKIFQHVRGAADHQDHAPFEF